jgi:PAS domain S-box-containing protein
VHQKTEGNPFFAIQFFTALAEEGLLAFDPVTATWQWDVSRIRAKSYTDNVVDLMAGKLRRFRALTQEAMKQLACLGNIADFATLALVHGEAEESMHAALWEAVHAGLVLRERSAYKFLHDRIQQAAYTLIPEERRAEVHLQIGRLLLTSMTAENLAEHLFDVANQLNRGAARLVEWNEKIQVAGINLRVGEKAKASAAFASACTYLAGGMALLEERDWDGHYELMFRLRLERAECEFLTGNFEQAEQLIEELLRRGPSIVDQAAVHQLKVMLHMVKSENAQAVAIALKCLGLFGIDIPAHPTQEQVQAEYEMVWRNLDGRPIESLIDLPPMTDPELRAAMQILSTLISPAYFTDIRLLTLLVCRIVNMSNQHGVCDASPHGCAYLGVVLGSVFHHYREGYSFARLACDLVEKHGFIAYQARAYHTMGLIGLWTQPITTAIDFNRTAFRTAIETGDLAFACYTMDSSITMLLLRNAPLEAVWRESEKNMDFVLKARFHDVAAVIVSQQQFIATMQGRTSSFTSFSDAQFDEAAFEAQLTGNRTATMICLYWIIKLKARFLSGDYAEALGAADQAKALLWSAPAHIQILDYFYYTALTVAALYEKATADEQTAWRDLLTVHRKQLREWAENYPPTFADKHALVSAEIARIEGRDLDAMRLYQEAIRAARENGFIQNEALAYELAACFYAARGFEDISHLYMQKARYCYQRWGADGKVRQLDALYPDLREKEIAPGPVDTIGAPLESLDLATVIKVSQTVSGEIVFEKLINTLMRTALEHAGAERGLLILARGKEQRIEAEALLGQGSEGQAHSERNRVTVQFRHSLVTPADLPESLLLYVIRTQESVTLRDASAENLFSQDEYIRQKQPRSVFCLPLIRQGRLVGVLYLENNLAPGVFTSKQLAILELIASDAAISLEQARLYGELSQENSERRKAEKALRASEERWRKLFENSSAGIALMTLDGRLFAANYAFQKMLGYTEQELHRLTSLDLTIEEDRPADEALRAEAVAGQWRDYRVERRFRRKDGSAVWTDVSAVCVPVAESESGFFSAVIVDITERKQAEEMQITIAHEREMLMRQRAADLAKANEALRSCLDALASVPELDAFIGQVMATITRQLGAVSSNLRVLDPGQKGMRIELLFQDGSVMSPADAGYPERFQSLALEGIGFSFLEAPYTVLNLSAPRALEMPADLRTYLQGLGVRTLLIIPLVSQGCINGLLNFRFAEERDFEAEELEIARALATQASLAIHLTELATSAKQSAVLEERTRLAGEIHDSLAQCFTGVTMQLEMAKELKTDKDDEVFNYVDRANDLARFGLAEARRSVLSLHSMTDKDSGLVESLQILAERSNIAGRLRCTFRSNLQDDECVPIEVRQDLLRIAQEAISNALRHAKSTAISVTLRSDPPNLVLKVKDNGIGIATRAETKEGFGFVNMRARVKKLMGTLDVRTVPGRGTSITVRVPFKQEVT